ncbi:Transcription initiation factor TFIID subunit 9 [Ciborinia camelliae]|nr:Transcription initiation factor TFIID subunit 9 [Ciborinia camelliae]
MADVNGDSVPHTNGQNGHISSSPPSQFAAAPASQPTAPASAAASPPISNPSVPLTSIQDNGLSKRPRDARLIHMLLSSLGVAAYQERVPLQLLDFAYRHSSSILSDALHLSSDAYVSQQTRARDAPPGGGFRDADGQVSANAVQLAIQSRLQYQFGAGTGGGLSKEFLLETAQARNKVALPRVLQNEWGVRLPAERFVLTGVPWGLKDEWVEDDEEEEGPGGESMEGIIATEEENLEGDEEGAGDMNDLFGTGGDMDEDMDKEE